MEWSQTLSMIHVAKPETRVYPPLASSCMHVSSLLPKETIPTILFEASWMSGPPESPKMENEYDVSFKRTATRGGHAFTYQNTSLETDHDLLRT
jgi:hypothetical protein